MKMFQVCRAWLIASCLILIAGKDCMSQQDQPTVARRMTPELMWKLGRLGSVAFSPDGQTIAYAVRRYELSENKGTSSLYFYDLATGKTETVLEEWKSIGSLYWISSNAGERLWFDGTAPAVESKAEQSATDQGSSGKPNEPVAEEKPEIDHASADGSDKAQAWFITKANRKPTRATLVKDGISNFRIAPSGDRIAFTQRIKLDQTATELYADLPMADARIIDGLMYRHWDTWHDYKYSHLHTATLDEQGIAGKAVDLMPGIKAHCPVPPMGGKEQFDFSPDGKFLAYTLKDVPDWAQSTNSDVFLIPADGSAPPLNLSAANTGYDNNPLFSPDGKWLVYNSMQRPGFEADRNRLMIVDRSNGQSRELTISLDQNANHPQWLPDSSGLVFESESRGTNQLFHLEVASGKLRQVSKGQYDWSVQTIRPDGLSMLATCVDMIRPPELVRLSLSSESKQTERPASAAEGANKADAGVSVEFITDINGEIYSNLELPTVEERWVTATDGAKIHCWVIYPPGFDKKADKKWPMMTYCQGGPQSQISQFFSFRWNFHLMAAQDYVVLAVNRRGLPGFGQKWNDDISGDWGGQAMRDLLSATDSMTQEPFIDAKRVAAVGASFGGYSVYWLMGNAGDRFCAMISHCGVFNLESMYGTTEELFFVNHDLGGPYWKSAASLAKYKQFSPHQFIGNWKTPLLVIHGEKDFRVPIGQGMEAFTAAQIQKVPSRFLYFPEEGHWVMSPQNGVLWNRVFFDWLDRYCKSK
jgi:dipeptidyl aminopeptidase/acylaminoacyl peptidase